MEYEVEPLFSSITRIREQLKFFAEQGWELITIVHQPDATKELVKSGFSSHVAYLKKA